MKNNRNTILIGLFLLLLLSIITYYDTKQRLTPTPRTKKALIINPLSTDNNDFLQAAMLLEDHGYKTLGAYGEEVTVDYLKNIKGRYQIVILRVHSTINNGKIWFFTGEHYRQDKYVLEQLADEVHRARPSTLERYLFAVGSDFVLQFMENKFKDSLIIVMGCDGLKTNDLAHAFTETGASCYVSWNGPVSLSHTDKVTLCLLDALLEQDMTIKQAIDNAQKHVGVDPTWGSKLECYPKDQEGLHLN